MTLLLSVYFWVILAGLTSAPVLAILGIQLATRDRGMQTLCVGQGAMLGVLLGIGALQSYSQSVWYFLGPLSAAVGFSALTFVGTDQLANRPSRSTVFLFIFALLMAVSHLIAALLPGLEVHMSQVYFGDLATLSERNAQIMLGGSLVCGAVLWFGLRMFSNQSFEWAVFGQSLSPADRLGEWVFKAITLLVLSLGIQFVGFLYTISVLFLPTAMLSFMRHQGLRLHFLACSLLAVFGTGVGFLLSLYFTRLPTVPSIVGTMFVGGLIVLVLDRSIFEIVAWARRSQLRAGVSGVEPG